MTNIMYEIEILKYQQIKLLERHELVFFFFYILIINELKILQQ